MKIIKWWDEIPRRVTLANTDVTKIHSQGYAIRGEELALEDILDDTLVASCFSIFFAHPDRVTLTDFWLELQDRANSENYKIQGSFNLQGLDQKEMLARVERVRINLAILSGIESLPQSHHFRFNPNEYSTVSDEWSLMHDSFEKFLSNLPDDEIAELAAIAESGVMEWMPAHKDVLIQAYDRSKSNNFQ